MTCIAPPREASLSRSGIACTVKGYHSFTCTPCVLSASRMTHTCLCLPSRSWYSFTDPRTDGRLSRPWCEVASTKIRTCNLRTANPALYHTATSAPRLFAKKNSRKDREKDRHIHIHLTLQTIDKKICAAFIFMITSRNVDQFSYFFSLLNSERICGKISNQNYRFPSNLLPHYLVATDLQHR